MKVEIKQNVSIEATCVEIHCREVSNDIVKLKKYIGNYNRGISAMDAEHTYIVPLNEIFYVESVDKKVYIYTEDKVLTSRKKLYELEELLESRNFFRCSKSVIVNLMKITKLKPEITRNILATLSNGEIIVISRRYAKDLKHLIGVED